MHSGSILGSFWGSLFGLLFGTELGFVNCLMMVGSPEENRQKKITIRFYLIN